MSENVSLTAKQHRAIAALISSPTVGEAAKAAGVSERTLARWMGDPDFRMALGVVESDMIDGAVRCMIGDLTANHDTMRAILSEDERRALDAYLRRMNESDDPIPIPANVKSMERRIMTDPALAEVRQRAGWFVAGRDWGQVWRALV